MMPRIFSLIILLLFFFLHTAAQNPHPAWRNYTSDHGLPSQEVHCILQDKEGFMWFGTDNGVSRFDGYTFRNFGPREGLQDIVVFELQEDQRGRIWMNTMGGNIYYLEQDSIHAYPHNDTIQQYRDRFSIAQKFYVDSLETVYNCLNGLGILKIEKNGKHVLYQCRYHCSELVMKQEEFFLNAYSAYEGRPGSKDSLYFMLRLRKKWAPVEFLTDDGWFQTEEFEALDIKGSSKIFNVGADRFLLQNHYGIYFIDHYKVIWQRPIAAEIIYTLVEEDGSIWLALKNGDGLQKYASVEALKNNSCEQYLEGYSIARVYRDRQGGYWAASLENGIYYTPDFSMLVYDQKAGLPTSNVSAVEPASQGDVFIGLRDGGLYKMSPLKLGLERLPPKASPEPVYDLYYHEENEVLWVGSSIIDYYLQGETNLLSYWHDRLKRRSWASGKRFFPLPQKNRLWAASHMGLSLIDLNNLKYQFTSVNAYETALFKNRVLAILEDFNGKIWLGLEKGLYDWNDGHPLPVNIQHPAFQLRVEDLAQLPDSTIVIGTKGQGVALWKGDDIRQFATADGLTADMIENVHVDELGQIWVGTLNGLNKFRCKNGKWAIEQMTTAHGLPSNAINMVKTAGEYVWVATDRGLAHFKDERQVDDYSPLPKVTAVFADRRAVDFHASVRLTFWENNVTIHFATLNYRMNGKVPYRFRVDGEPWTPTMNTSVNFPSLPPGDRLFEVQSQNEDGIWSEPASFHFHIAPPWWETWWVISLGLLLMGASIFGFYKYRTTQLKKEIALHKQLGDVERQALRSQMNPHFIFNALNAIQGYIAQGDKASANRYLSRFAKLIRAALQHSRVTKVPLADDLSSLENYLELEQLRFQGGFDFQIKVGENIDTTDIDIPPMLVQPFVENAIIHGMANKEGKGQIDLDYQFHDGLLQVTITDNGIGIEASKKQKAGLASSHKSVGMTVTARRLEMLSGNGDVGRVETAELKDDKGQVTGTQVRVWIPVEAF